jgi:predicted site-specific integrase-resolvase
MKRMTPREVADYVGISLSHARAACRKGLIRGATKVPCLGGYQYMVTHKEVDRYMNNRPKSGPKPKGE